VSRVLRVVSCEETDEEGWEVQRVLSGWNYTIHSIPRCAYRGDRVAQEAFAGKGTPKRASLAARPSQTPAQCKPEPCSPIPLLLPAETFS
jgi:hypothetical protein